MSSNAASVAIPSAAARPPLTRRVIYAASIGNVMEWYDFNIFAFMAVPLAHNFFPKEDPTAALLSTFAVFGVGLVVRPLGGYVIGRMGDTSGRKPALILTVLLMAASTALIGILPSYGTVGILAPMLLLIGRLMQGFSTGGEWGGATTFMAEWSEPGKRGLQTSYQQLSNAIGLLVGSGIGAALASLLTVDAINSWGWRVPFLLGGLFGPIGFWLRRSTEETPPFRAAEAAPHAARPVSETVRLVATGIGFTAGWTVCFYAFLNFMPTFTRLQLKLSQAEALWSNTIGIIAFTLLIPAMGALSDRIGRRPVLLTSCVLFMALPVPAFWLMLHGWGYGFVIAMQIVFGAALALFSGPGPAAIAELFPTRGRSTWLSLSFSAGVAIFGGFTPFIAQFLIAATGSPLAPTIYVIAAVALSFCVILSMRETAHAPLP